MNELLSKTIKVPSVSGGTIIPAGETSRYQVTSRSPSWGASNLANLLGGGNATSQAELDAAVKAIASLDLRANEDTEQWANELGTAFATYRD